MNAIRFNFQFDVQKMAEELRVIASSFETIHSRSTQDNMLQGIHLITSIADGQRTAEGHTYQVSPELERSPYLQSVLETFKCDKFNYRVHNLTPQGKITLHRDHGRSIKDRVIRIHIPVTTNDDIYFYVDGERIQMQNGECWLADISKPHEVENRSPTDRMQLMIDCDLNDWWEKILADHGVHVPAVSNWSHFDLGALRSMKENLGLIGSTIDSALLEELDLEIAQRSEQQA
jgi:hypothetical protein